MIGKACILGKFQRGEKAVGRATPLNALVAIGKICLIGTGADSNKVFEQ